jgi:hypothetical protein
MIGGRSKPKTKEADSRHSMAEKCRRRRRRKKQRFGERQMLSNEAAAATDCNSDVLGQVMAHAFIQGRESRNSNEDT